VIERASTPEARRRLGVYDTPAPLAAALVRFAASFVDGVPDLVADPSCGNGRFLLAAADHLVERGVRPDDVCARLVGLDVDPGAVAEARSELAAWCRRHGVAEHVADVADLRVLDTLVDLPADLGGRVDLVVGNPPFLSQTARATRRSDEQRRAVADRLGEVGPLADTAALFALAFVWLHATGRRLAYRYTSSSQTGGSSGITAEDFQLTDSIDPTTLVLFAVCRRPTD